MEVDFGQIISNIRVRKYRCIGSGSGRVVFDLDNGTVIKVAKNVRGTAQNHAEDQISSNDNGNLFAKVYAVSDNFRLLIMEKADRINSIRYVWNYFNVKNNKELRRNNELRELAEKHSLLLSDFVRSVNWGIKNDKPIIIDYGFTKSVARKYY